MAASFVLPGLSFIGLVVSLYLLYGQKAGKKLVCLIGHDCDEVVKSAYGRTFGFENTLLGVVYYGGMLIVSALQLPVPQVALALAAALAGIFSVYLIYVQAFVMRKWCDYCVLSAFLSWGMLYLILAA